MREVFVLRGLVRAAVSLMLLAVLGAAGRAPADVTTEHGASILMFPRILADAADDTVVQLANLSTKSVDVVCTYVNGAPPSWQSLGFTLTLESGRPTQWTAARGRTADGGSSVAVPAAPAGFRGELICVQVDVEGAPSNDDDLAGAATIVELATGNVAAYAAAGLRGTGYVDRDNALCLGGAPFEQAANCPNPLGAEYEGCPAEWILGVPAEGAADAQIGPASTLSTRLSVAACSQDLQAMVPGSVAIDITVFNALGQPFTASAAVTGWADLSLADIGGSAFTPGTLGTDFAAVHFRPAPLSGGFVLVAQTTRAVGDTGITGSTAAVAHSQGSAATADLLVLPEVSP